MGALSDGLFALAADIASGRTAPRVPRDRARDVARRPDQPPAVEAAVAAVPPKPVPPPPAPVSARKPLGTPTVPHVMRTRRVAPLVIPDPPSFPAPPSTADRYYPPYLSAPVAGGGQTPAQAPTSAPATPALPRRRRPNPRAPLPGQESLF